MKFGATLAESLLPHWREYYIDYEALKQKLKQARDASDDFPEASHFSSTSLSIPRAVSQSQASFLQQHQEQLQHAQQQQRGAATAAAAAAPAQQQSRAVDMQKDALMHQQVLMHAGSGSGLRVPEALQLGDRPAEQFLQQLQQELNKVRDFVVATSSSLQAELQQLATAAPQLSRQDSQQLEQRAAELGRELLSLEAFVQLNQAGFVKIVKKHDKWLPDAPIWHLYLHHLQRSPWWDDNTRQQMWAALSSCYYHLHAASLRASRAQSMQQQRWQQQQQRQPSVREGGCSMANNSRPSSAFPITGAPDVLETQVQPSGPSSSSTGNNRRRVMGGLSSAFGSAMAGAANAVAGAATAVAGASAAALTAAATASASGAGVGAATTLLVPESAAGVMRSASASASGLQTVSFTKKFWVQESDVPAVMYFILQQLPLLPSRLHPAAADSSGTQTAKQAAATTLGTQRPHTAQEQQPDQQQQRRRSSNSGSQQQQQQRPPLLSQPALEGLTTTLHTVYFDNVALQLYHGRLFLRPRTTTLKARWIGGSNTSSSSTGGGSSSGRLDSLGAAFAAAAACPEKVVLERKVYREGWKGEPNKKNSLLIAGDRLPEYLAGAYTLGDALADLYEVPACKAQLVRASRSVPRRPQYQVEQVWVREPVRQQQVKSPFAQVNAAAAAAALGEQPDVAAVAAAINSESASEDSDDSAEERAAAVALAASVRVPRGLAIGSFSGGRSPSHGGGSHPSLLQLLERERLQQQQQGGEQRRASTPEAAAAGAAEPGDELQEGFEEEYLDPPVPNADQLSLFTEVQRFVGGSRLRPVLHCVMQRMIFAMPFDDRIRITLDTDVKTTALGQDMALTAADWRQRQQMSMASSRTGSGMLSPDNISDHGAAAAAAAAGGPNSIAAISSPLGGPQLPPLPPRPASSGSTSSAILPELHASRAAWEQIFGPQAATPDFGFAAAAESPWGSSRDGGGGSPAFHPRSSSGGGGVDSSHHPVVYHMPYALLKVTCELPANQATPDWLQELMQSEATIPVEEFSKFIHGCAVLLPETVRAVPYWMDDPLIELSAVALQSQLEAEQERRDQLRLQNLQERAASRNSSAPGTPLAVVGGGSSSGGGAVPGSSTSPQPQQQQQRGQILAKLSGSIKHVLGGGGSSSSGGHAGEGGHLQHSSSLASNKGPHSAPDEQQQQRRQLPPRPGAPAAAGATNSDGGGHGKSRLSVRTQGGAVPRVSWADGGAAGSNSSAPSTPAQSDTTPLAAAAAAGQGKGLMALVWRLRRREKQPPLFRPELSGSSSFRGLRRYNPVQLLESREFFYSEAILLSWLNLAITLASVAVLLMGYSSMAYVNPLKRPALHLAELICVMMLPCSCVMVGYAIRSYLWRSGRLHSMRYSRVDDPVGPLVMAFVFVVSMVAIMLVNIADLVLLLRDKHKPDPDVDPTS